MMIPARNDLEGRDAVLDLGGGAPCSCSHVALRAGLFLFFFLNSSTSCLVQPLFLVLILETNRQLE